MKITIVMKTDNAAFGGCTNAEVAQILSDIASNLDDAQVNVNIEQTIQIRDLNGNPVGYLKVTED